MRVPSPGQLEAFAAENAVDRAASSAASDFPSYCPFCSRVHSGFKGFFVNAAHRIAFFFCKLFGIERTEGRMRFTEITIDAGAEEPFELLHISDTHLTLCDDRDDEKKRELAESRYQSFPYALRMLDDAAAKAEELGCTIIHTGDIIDFVSEQNLDRVGKFTSENDVLFAAGNHEFYQYIFGESCVPEQRDANIGKVQNAFSNDIRFTAKQINGVNIVMVDNGFYHFDKWQLDRLKKEISKGMPILLCLHVPLYAPDIYAYTKEFFGRALWMMSVPTELMGDCTEGELEEQKEDSVTHEAYELITHSDCIKAVLAGHMHYDFVSQLTPSLKQYVVNVDAGNVVKVK